MKKITFDKAILIRFGAWRKDFPGYLFEHSAHPGREFVIARGSRARLRDAVVLTREWRFYDRASGINLSVVCGERPTRKEVEEYARAALFRYSPEQVAKIITNKVVERATKILQEK